MSQRKVTRRMFACSTGAAIAITLWPSSAKASLFGEENASLLAILAQLIQQVQNAVKTVEGVFQTANEVIKVGEYTKTILHRLNHIDSLHDVLNVLDWAQGAISTLRRLDRDVTKLGYQYDRIDQQFEKLFPTEESLENVPSTDFPKQAKEWNTALRESSVVAMRAQTSVETLKARADAQKRILDESKSTDGLAALLQTVVAGLALLHSDLASIETNIAAGLRVTSVLASEQAARQDIIAEDHRRMLDGYTDDEPASGPVLTELP
jgi:type IV secretion system protein TrbJ